MSDNDIVTPDDMANALKRMIFGEVHRLETISERINDIEDDLLDAVSGNENVPMGLRVKIYDALSNRKRSGQGFVLQFFKLLDEKGAFNDGKEAEKLPDATMSGDLELDDNDRRIVAGRLREIAQRKVLEENATVEAVVVEE